MQNSLFISVKHAGNKDVLQEMLYKTFFPVNH